QFIQVVSIGASVTGLITAGSQQEEQERTVRGLEDGGPVSALGGVVDLDRYRVATAVSRDARHRSFSEDIVETVITFDATLVLDVNARVVVRNARLTAEQN
ncbi:MAG: hypothetical protein R3282_08330, partial [Rhodothermales bacterium]|nr:hypothetical protein [Rhodothermales bacterium]